MLSELLKGLDSLDYFMLVVKSTDNRLGESAQFIYNSIQGLYAVDISERVLGMFTFSDDCEPNALAGVKASGIKISDSYFKFNNSFVYIDPSKNTGCKAFFNLAMSNYGQFAKYIVDKNQIPVSLQYSQEVLYKRKEVEIHGHTAKKYSIALTRQMKAIAQGINKVRNTAAY